MSNDHQSSLQIDLRLQKLLDERGIRQQTLQQVICSAETDHRFHIDPVTGHQLAYCSLPHVTYWVEYQNDAQGYTIFSAYSHRMKILEGFKISGSARSTGRTLARYCWK
jgi:glutamate synthase (NADPH) small chain